MHEQFKKKIMNFIVFITFMQELHRYALHDKFLF